GPFDAIFVFEVSPVTVGIPAIAAGRRFKSPIFFWVLDLWPESIQAAGRINSPTLLYAMDKLVRWIYRRCHRILVQSQAFIPEITGHAIRKPGFLYFRNGGGAFFQRMKRGDLPLWPPLPTGLNIVFAENIGKAQDFPAILKAAEILRARQ